MMTSTIGWLDTSADEQRKVREMIALFSQRESRDELGIGQIRDVFSDTLFPGTSVIQTRARYFLFVPWLFQAGAKNGRSGSELQRWTETQERRLVDTLKKAGHTDGLIGSRAGPAVKILPSTIYWSGLGRYQILARDVASDRLLSGRRHLPSEADEVAARTVGEWTPTLPVPPSDFPTHVPGGFDLTATEASWLKDQILTTAPGTALAHLLTSDHAPDSDSSAPWIDSVCSTVSGPAGEQLQHAWMFALAMHGAALLYNLQLAERYEKAGLTGVASPVDFYRNAFADWAEEANQCLPQLTAWDQQAMWDHVLTANPRITVSTQLFVRTWLAVVTDTSAMSAATDPALRSLVESREVKIKKAAQSRLLNPRLLAAWSGDSGAGRLAYRWRQVRRMTSDLHDGLAH